MSRPRAILSVCLALALSACQQEVILPLPPQRTLSPYQLSLMLDMNPARTSWSGASILDGVATGDEDYGWRWTGPHPLFRFNLDQAEGWLFQGRITAIGSVLSKVGPQTANVIVNGKTVTTLKLDHPGSYDFHIPMPASAFVQPANTTVELVTAPCLAQLHGPPLCVLLHQIGFTRDFH